MLAGALALGSMACHSPQPVGLIPGAGYSPRDSYERGFGDGSIDRISMKTHNPHINQSDTLPSAHRLEYVWGYNEGYKSPYLATRRSGAYHPSK